MRRLTPVLLLGVLVLACGRLDFQHRSSTDDLPAETPSTVGPVERGIADDPAPFMSVPAPGVEADAATPDMGDAATPDMGDAATPDMGDAAIPDFGDAVAVYFTGGDGLDDVAGDGPTGTCAPCPLEVGGSGPPTYRFDGSTVVNIADDGRFDGTSGFTVALWVQPTDSGARTFISKLLGTGFLNSFRIAVRPNFEFETATSSGRVHTLEDSAALPLDTWTHFAATWDGTTKRLYVDGALVQMRNRSGVAFDRGDIVVGADQDSGTPKDHFVGELRELLVYDRALGDAELAELAR